MRQGPEDDLLWLSQLSLHNEKSLAAQMLAKLPVTRAHPSSAQGRGPRLSPKVTSQAKPSHHPFFSVLDTMNGWFRGFPQPRNP
jgi:hypothetical protein